MKEQPKDKVQELIDQIREGKEQLRHGEKDDYWRKKVRTTEAELEAELWKGQKR